MKKTEEVRKAEFKEQIHRCSRYIFISTEIEGEIKIYKLTFSKNYGDINFDHIQDSDLVSDYRNCPYCGKLLVEYQ